MARHQPCIGSIPFPWTVPMIYHIAIVLSKRLHKLLYRKCPRIRFLYMIIWLGRVYVPIIDEKKKGYISKSIPHMMSCYIVMVMMI